MALVGDADVIENEAGDHIDPVNRWINIMLRRHGCNLVALRRGSESF